jgi:hypothetical protein
VRGAGTAVIRHIVHDVLKQIQSKKERGPEPSLLLNSVPLAVGFYKKLGFEEDKDPRTKISNDLITMKLSVNKMKKLLKRDSTAIILFSENVASTANKAL